MTKPVAPLYTPGCELKPGMTPPDNGQRWALTVEYLGRDFNGFARQATAPNTIQQRLEAALSKVACEDIQTICAGRTDAGVHATKLKSFMGLILKR